MSRYEVDFNIELKNAGKDLRDIEETAIEELKQNLKSLSLNSLDMVQNLAQKKIRKGHEAYLDALQHYTINNNDQFLFVMYLSPENKFANAIEDGAPKWDLKPGLLAGNSAKMSKAGVKYTTVPIGHSPHASSVGSTKQMRSYQKEVTQLMGRKSFIAKETKLGEGKGIISYKPQPNMKIKNLYQIYSTTTGDNGKSRVNSSYITFLRVSENTDSSKWWHPEIIKAGIFDEVEEYVKSQIEEMVRQL